MQVGDLIACDHCLPVMVNETLENGTPITIERPVLHEIEEIVGGRPTCHCPSLYTDQIHESARMRLIGTAERP